MLSIHLPPHPVWTVDDTRHWWCWSRCEGRDSRPFSLAGLGDSGGGGATCVPRKRSGGVCMGAQVPRAGGGQMQMGSHAAHRLWQEVGSVRPRTSGLSVRSAPFGRMAGRSVYTHPGGPACLKLQCTCQLHCGKPGKKSRQNRNLRSSVLFPFSPPTFHLPVSFPPAHPAGACGQTGSCSQVHSGDSPPWWGCCPGVLRPRERWRDRDIERQTERDRETERQR